MLRGLYFFTKLQEFVPNTDDLIFISNRQQSIKKAVCSVYNNTYHGYCMWHVEQNLKSFYTCQVVIDLFKKAAHANHISQFIQLWMEIQNMYPRVTNDLTTNITFDQ